MLINIKHHKVVENGIDITICHDNYGNIYFKHDKNYYFLVVGNDDNLEIHQTYNILKMMNHGEVLTFGKVKSSNDEKSLKGKILNKIEEEKTQVEEEKNEDVLTDDEDETERHEKYYPDDKYYYYDDQPDEEEVDEEDDTNEFKFYKSGDTSILEYLDIIMDSPSNYNTLVMNPFTKVVEMSLESNISNDYILIIYTNGQFDLNVVGSKRKTFKLSYVDSIEEEILGEGEEECCVNIKFIVECVRNIPIKN
jgi:hypothetical protein